MLSVGSDNLPHTCKKRPISPCCIQTTISHVVMQPRYGFFVLNSTTVTNLVSDTKLSCISDHVPN